MVCSGQRCPLGITAQPKLIQPVMDESAERLRTTHSYVADVPAVLFADDVLITAKSPTGLQTLLRFST